MPRGWSREWTLLLCLCVMSNTLAAQAEPEAAGLPAKVVAQMKSVQAAALKSDGAWTSLQHLTDNIGARPAGSPQYQQAAEYVVSQLRAAGLEVRLEKVTVPRWVRGEERAELAQWVGMAPGTTQKLVVTALGNSVATPPEGITAEVVVAHDFAELASLGRAKVSGKIVVFAEKFDQRMAAAGQALKAYEDAVEYRGRGASAAARLGAVASLVRSAGTPGHRLAHTGWMGYEKDAPQIPAGALASEDADLIERLAQQGPVRVRLLLTPRRLADATDMNVIADIKGSRYPEQVVIVSGHLDSWDLGTGALDDGAGVVSAMEAIRVLQKLRLRGRRTIRFVAWANEENGLSGGIEYSIAHKAEVGQHYAAIETDLGAGHLLGMEVDADASAVPLLKPMAQVLAAQGAGLVHAGTDTGADCQPLSVAGVPTFAPVQDARTYFDYHHSAADMLDKVDAQELRENVAFAAVLAYGLANLEQPLKGVAKPVPAWLKEAQEQRK